MRTIVDAILKRFIVIGRFTVRWPNNDVTTYGGTLPGPEAAARINDGRTLRRLVINPSLAFGEAFMDGGLEPDRCDIYDVLDVMMTNMHRNAQNHPVMWVRDAFRMIRRRFDQYNPAARSKTNVAHHYDLNGELYALFLDADRQYSCAYFETGNETLDEAQRAKKHHLAAKLYFDRPNLKVLDIGSGWGGLAITLARDYGAQVTGITLSEEQLAVARARAEAEGLSDRVRFELQDYRHTTASYDRVVSVGMFEHVGVQHYGEFFNIIRRCLRPDGVAVLHSIGRSEPPDSTNPWILKYIFPGGYCPALSEVLPALETSGLYATDVEILRLHYATTLRHWRQRFLANRETIAKLYDERFCRMFEFYLCGSELSFRVQRHMVFQIQITQSGEHVPLTRDYIYAEPTPTITTRTQPTRTLSAAAD